MLMKHNSISALVSQRGFTLIEAMVGFLILSVGMLGIASLQTLSLQAGHTAGQRTIAVLKAQEILERMRTNPTVLISYQDGGTGTDHGCNDLSGAITDCTAVQMAQDDLFNWNADLTDTLKSNNTTGTITYVAGSVANPLAKVTVTIGWEERAEGSQTLVAKNYSTSQYMCEGVIEC